MLALLLRPSTEDMSDEILTIPISRPSVDTRLGIRLASATSEDPPVVKAIAVTLRAAALSAARCSIEAVVARRALRRNPTSRWGT
jgi:hypothetical protein